MNLSMRDKKILLMFIGILVFFVGWFFGYRPQMEMASQIEASNGPLEERLQEFAEHWRKAGTDVTDSYALLPGSDWALWHQYRDDETQYVEDLIYEVQVR